MESEVSFESALQKLKSMFACPTEDGRPVKGTWCANCREICDADGTNWCDRNWYLGSVLAVEAAHDRETASLRAKRNEQYEYNLKLRSLINEFVGIALLLKDEVCVGCPQKMSLCEEQKCSLVKCTDALVVKAREVCK